jgi:hypothetical protein
MDEESAEILSAFEQMQKGMESPSPEPAVDRFLGGCRPFAYEQAPPGEWPTP